MQPPTTSMPSLATNNQEAKNDSDGDDAVTCELQDQRGATLNVEKYTSASFTTQPSLSTSGFIVPESVLPIVATSEHTASTNDRESDIPSDRNYLVSEANHVNKPTQENEGSTTGIFQYPSQADLKQIFSQHPFQPLDDLPSDARLYGRKVMSESVPRKWLK